MIGGLLSWIAGKKNALACRWISLTAVLAALVMIVVYWISVYDKVEITSKQSWLVDLNVQWIPQWGVSFHLAMDGLSLLMTVLTLFLGALSVIVSWKEINTRVGFFHFNILWLLAGILGVFLSMDMLLFYFFWEVMLIPMYFILAIWGHENRRYAGMKFFLFTQLSGLLMLIAIIGLYFIHGNNTGQYSFDYFELIGTSLSAKAGFWLMCGFLIAFLTKLPALPFHSWLPDAYTQSPTGGSVILAALMSKTAAYGILRFVLPFFPDAAQEIAPVVIIIGVAGILYGAKLAYAQSDLKRMIAFSSLSHVGFILVGIFSFQALAYQGTIIEMIAHGISISALFIIAGAINARTGNRDVNLMGRFWEQIPKMGGITLIFVLATLGLPGLGNFIAEFLILAGAFQTNMVLAIIATLGLVASMIYALVILQKIFQGERKKEWTLSDFSTRELVAMGSLIIAIVGLGVYPQPVIKTVQPVINNMKMKDDAFRYDKMYHLGNDKASAPTSQSGIDEKNTKTNIGYIQSVFNFSLNTKGGVK
jgi:NADH-quinone oxidoreductase subunit M